MEMNKYGVYNLAMTVLPVMTRLGPIESLTNDEPIVNNHLHAIYILCASCILDEACSIACNAIPNSDWFVNNFSDLVTMELYDMYNHDTMEADNYSVEIDNLAGKLFDIMLPVIPTAVLLVRNTIHGTMPTLQHPYTVNGYVNEFTHGLPYGILEIVK